MTPRKIILDVDTGSDDAVAIMAAILSPDIQLEAICSVWGSRDIDTTTRNTLRVVQLMEADVPVYRGCRGPIAKNLCPDRLGPRRYDGGSNCRVEKDGKLISMHADFDSIPEAVIREQEISAVEFYLRYLRETPEPVTLVATGRLTNIALALSADARIADNIREIVVMGGGYNMTNVTPSAEGNIFGDPEACQILLNSGVKITFVPLDATHEACVTADDCKRFRELGTVAGKFAAEQCEQRILIHNSFQPLDIPNAAAVHDPLCIVYLIDPTVLKDVRHVYCTVGLRDFSDGQTILDMRHYTEPANCWFAFGGDRIKYVEILCDLFSRSRKL